MVELHGEGGRHDNWLFRKVEDKDEFELVLFGLQRKGQTKVNLSYNFQTREERIIQ